MATLIGIGHSKKIDPIDAAKEAAITAKRQSNISEADLVIIFTTPGYDTLAAMDSLTPILRPKQLIGSTTTALITTDGIATKGISIIAITSDELTFHTAATQNSINSSAEEIGVTFGRAVTQSGHIAHQGIVYFSDLSFTNQNALAKGIQSVLGSPVPIVGCVSSDHFEFKNTQQIHNQNITRDTVCGFSIYGSGALAVGSKHGWTPLGKPRLITEVDGNIICTIDNEPAINIYQEYFEDPSRDLSYEDIQHIIQLYPLGIYFEQQEQYVVRQVIDITSDGALVCQTAIPNDTEVHLMIGSKDSLKQAVQDAALEVKQNLFSRQAKVIIVFESAIRYKLFGRGASQEIQLIRDILGYTTPIIGMYGYGETAPTTTSIGRHINFYNGSISIAAIA